MPRPCRIRIRHTSEQRRRMGLEICAWRLTTSWCDGSRGPGLALLQPVVCPPLPAFGHSRHRKQPVDFMAITGVDAKYVANGQIVIGFVDDPDLISGPNIALGDDSQI